MFRWPSIISRLNPATQYWLAAYGCLACAHLGAKWWQFKLFSYATKPLLMALLLAYLHRAMPGGEGGFRFLLSWGLVFALLGDVFLMLAEIAPAQHDVFYLCGMGSFLLTHGFYIAAFARYRWEDKGLLRRRPWAALPLLAVWGGMNWYLSASVPPFLFVPMVIYGTALTLMALSCLNLQGKVAFGAWYQMFAGVLLFLLSDSMIALNKHKFAIPQAGFWIMLTYLLAQYLIAEGAIAAKKQAETHA
jgi:uncharacterized membrane protein YhhN